MMFPGTYTTEFYRAVRDLLHEEVKPTSSAGRQALRSRWHRLIEAESRFRHSMPLTPEHAGSSLRELGTAT